MAVYETLRTARYLARNASRAVSGKTESFLIGRSPPSATCQIPDIRNKYECLKLPKRDGIFVEIGAFDGEMCSNTSFLADQGWRGLYVEPIGSYYRLTRLRHVFNHVRAENVGIARSAGTADISVMGALSTMNAETENHYQTLKWAKKSAKRAKTITIRTETLGTVLCRNHIPERFDLMVIDVEGGEEQIVEALLESKWRPRVLIIELCDVHPDFASNSQLTGSHARVRSGVVRAGYREFFIDKINTVFSLATQK